MKLYVKDIVREPNDTLYTFLTRVLKLNDTYKIATTNATYLDPEFKELQCKSEKHRSFDDLVLISKTYFKVSDKIIAKTLHKFLDNDKELMFVLCDSAEKWVLNSHLNKSEIIKYCGKYDNSDIRTSRYLKGKYSFDDILNLMGLTKEDIKINN